MRCDSPLSNKKNAMPMLCYAVEISLNALPPLTAPIVLPIMLPIMLPTMQIPPSLSPQPLEESRSLSPPFGPCAVEAVHDRPVHASVILP